MPHVPSEEKLAIVADRVLMDHAVSALAQVIIDAAMKRKDECHDHAIVDEMHYALTRLIQEIPRKLAPIAPTRGETSDWWLQQKLNGVLLNIAWRDGALL